ncbi:MAG: hypothetical protein KA712_07540 [Myxococcales bacterium]|nr:hypothetical protein [Myxococcales bacterium]
MRKVLLVSAWYRPIVWRRRVGFFAENAQISANATGCMLGRFRLALASVTLVFGLYWFGRELDSVYPFNRWLAWRFLSQLALSFGWGGAVLSAGSVLLRRFRRVRSPWDEHLVLSFALGVVVFGLGVFVTGILGGLGGVFFVTWPTLLLVASGPSLLSNSIVRWRRIRALASLHEDEPRWSWFVRGFGAIGIAIVLLQIMTPHNVAFDARWYHLAIAESYASIGKIIRFDDGWFLGTLPQLATWIYTWAMLCPGTSLAFRIELAAYTEFLIFLFTLAGVGAALRWLLRSKRIRGGWAIFFLFPGLFVYDSNLNLSADHVLALWALPLVLAGRRLFPRPGNQRPPLESAILVGIVFSGALLTKYQALYITVGSGWLVVAATVGVLLRAKRGQRGHLAMVVLTRLVLTGLTTLLVTTPHWLKNVVWHKNPVYPFARGVFGGVPWGPGIEFGLLDDGWTPEGPFWSRIVETVSAIASFSFRPHDWETFHRNWPVFGSLFSVLVGPALVLGASLRLLNLAIATCLALGVWYWTYHQDRYLQSILPWMVAATAAAIAVLWRSRALLVRITLFSAIALQIVWSADLPALPTHAMIGKSPISATMDRLSSGFRKAWNERDDAATHLQRVAARLPSDAVPLLHEEHLRLGLGRWVLTDSFGRQGAIRYRNWNTQREAYDRLRALGSTHILVREGAVGQFSLADDIVFFDLLRALPKVSEVEGYRIFSLLEGPPQRYSDRAESLVVGCRGLRFLPSIRDLDEEIPDITNDCQLELSGLEEASMSARFVVTQSGRLTSVRERLPSSWALLFQRDGVAVLAPGH